MPTSPITSNRIFWNKIPSLTASLFHVTPFRNIVSRLTGHSKVSTKSHNAKTVRIVNERRLKNKNEKKKRFVRTPETYNYAFCSLVMNANSADSQQLFMCNAQLNPVQVWYDTGTQFFHIHRNGGLVQHCSTSASNCAGGIHCIRGLHNTLLNMYFALSP